jgi:serine/threonine-protein kinase
MSEPLTATEPQVAPGTLSIPVPKTIGRFTILNEIGRGSYGVVWAAHDPVLGREVAIKIIPLAREAQFRTQIEANFLREAKSAGAMSHPSIVTIYDAGKTDTLAYIAMERLHGQDLHDYLATGSRMSPRQAATMMMRLADAIHYANKRGLVHRDIKPSNIFLSRDLKPKLLDFGTALAPVSQEDKDKSTRHLVGTPNYMSPEQAKGDALDARSDIFSLGTILYELLTGRRAFDGRTIDETLEQVVAAAPRAVDKIRPDTPPALVAIVRKAMERDPAQRYAKAADFRNALADFVDVSRPPTEVVASLRAPETVAVPASRVPLRFAVGAVGVAAVAILVYLALRPQPAPPPAVQVTPQPVVPAPAPVVEAPAESAATPADEAKPAEPKGTLRRRSENVVVPIPVPDGRVVLAVAPWGEVFVDGASRGVSPPLTQLSLPAGAHTIEIRNNSSPPLSVRIELKPGESISLQHRF